MPVRLFGINSTFSITLLSHEHETTMLSSVGLYLGFSQLLPRSLVSIYTHRWLSHARTENPRDDHAKGYTGTFILPLHLHHYPLALFSVYKRVSRTVYRGGRAAHRPNGVGEERASNHRLAASLLHDTLPLILTASVCILDSALSSTH
jgi:hypothetical protein